MWRRWSHLTGTRCSPHDRCRETAAAFVAAASLAEIKLELSLLLRGRKVDLRTARDSSRYFRDEVVRTAQVQYEAGWSCPPLPPHIPLVRRAVRKYIRGIYFQEESRDRSIPQMG
jgi:hypothetical protein